MLSDIFAGKAMGIKPKEIVDRALGVETKALSKLPKLQFDIAGFKRAKKQTKLKPLGDFDKDGVMNIFDCEPYNKKKQGFIDKTVNLVKGYGFVEDADINPFKTVMQADKEAIIQGAQATGTAIVKGAQATGTAIVKGAQATKQGIGNVYQASGAPEYLEQRAEQKAEQRAWEQGVRRAAQEEGLKYAQKLKAEEMFRTEGERVAGITPSRLPNVRGGLTEVGRATSQGVSPFVTGGSSGWENKVTSMIGFGKSGSGMNSALSLVGGAGRGYFPAKVFETVGGKQPIQSPMSTGYPMISSSGMRPMPSSTPISPQYPIGSSTSEERGMPPQPGMVWSEKSKKWVKYTRLAYRKHPRMAPEPISYRPQPAQPPIRFASEEPLY